MPHSCASFAQEWETTLTAQWALLSRRVTLLAFEKWDIGTLFNPVILSATLSFGEANDKVESKDPYVCQHRPRQRKAFSPCVIGGWPRLYRLHNQRRGCPILARPLRKSGNHTDRTMGFAFHAASAPK